MWKSLKLQCKKGKVNTMKHHISSHQVARKHRFHYSKTKWERLMIRGNITKQKSIKANNKLRMRPINS